MGLYHGKCVYDFVSVDCVCLYHSVFVIECVFMTVGCVCINYHSVCVSVYLYQCVYGLCVSVLH